MQDMDAIVLKDIRSLAQLVVEDEEKEKSEFLARKAKHHEKQYFVDTKKLTEGRYRLQELDMLIPSIYEDKVLGKVSEDVAMKLITKCLYRACSCVIWSLFYLTAYFNNILITHTKRSVTFAADLFCVL